MEEGLEGSIDVRHTIRIKIIIRCHELTTSIHRTPIVITYQ